VIHEIWLFLSGTGLPLWSKQFGRVKHTLDPTLIAGLLTAIKGFSTQAIGSELKDLVLESDRLHNFLVSEQILFTVHLDQRVPIEKVDSLLNQTKSELIKIGQESELPLHEVERLSFKKFQNLVEVITPVLEKLAVYIAQLRTELLTIYDESSFDAAQLTLLSKIPELVPILTKHSLSLTVKDLKTKKIHFQQITSEIDYQTSNSISDLINYLESQEFFLKDLEKIPSIIFISNAIVSTFKVPQVDNLINIFKDHAELDDLPTFRKILFELRKRIMDFYKK
jgi:hypothetical protein